MIPNILHAEPPTHPAELEAPLLPQIERTTTLRIYPSQDFPELEEHENYMQCIVPVRILEMFEKEEDACRNGRIAECCWRGGVSRLQYAGHFLISTPVNLISSVTELAWGTMCCGIGSVCSGLKVLSCAVTCGHRNYVSDKTWQTAKGSFGIALGCFGMSALSLAQSVWTVIRVPGNLAIPECMNGCLKQYKVDLCCAIANRQLREHVKNSEKYYNA